MGSSRRVFQARADSWLRTGALGALAVLPWPRCLARNHTDGPRIETGGAHPGPTYRSNLPPIKVPPGDSCTRTGTVTSWNRGESCGICRVVPRSRTVWSVATTLSSCTPRPPARDVPTHAMKAGPGSVARPLTRLLCGGMTSSVRYRFAAARSVRPARARS